MEKAKIINFFYFVEQFQVRGSFKLFYIYIIGQCVAQKKKHSDSNGLLGSAIPRGITMERSITDE